MKTRIVLGNIALVFGILALTFSTAVAQGQGKGRGKGHDKVHDKGAKVEKMADEMNLTDAQKAQIKTLRDNFKQRYAAQMEQIKSIQMQMKDARKSGNKDQAKQLHEQAKALREQMKPAREQLRRDILAVLTPEQRAKAEQMKEQRKEKHGGRGQAKEKGQGQGKSKSTRTEID